METFYTSHLHGFPNLSRSLLVGGGFEQAPLNEESVLSLLIVLGSSISLVGLVFAFITYSLFSDLRNLSGTTLMNLLAALFMTQLLYVIGVGGVPDSELCVALAFSLHYVRLCSFCWVLSMAHHMLMQFKTNLNLLPINDNAIGRHFVRYSLFAWGIPGALLLLAVLFQFHDKAGKLLDTTSLKEYNCWFLDNNAFIYGLVIPIAILLAAIVYYLIRAAIVARYVVNMQIDKRVRDKMRKKRTLQIALFLKITFILSSVIIFGSLSRFYRHSDALWIAYNTCQSLQGIFVAMLVTCNCHVLKIYTRTFRSKARSGTRTPSGRTTLVTKSTSLQLLTWDPTPDCV